MSEDVTKPTRPVIKTIVITGGPCSGKTTAIEWIDKVLRTRGYHMIFIPEVATELITGGVAPWTCTSYDEFQRSVIEMQLSKEKAFINAAKRMDQDEIVIILDRGANDNQGYMTPEGWQATLKEYGTTREELYARYDAVFHLVTAGKGAREAYTLENNKARAETPEQAASVDDRLIEAWSSHPRFRVIGNTVVFADKLNNLLNEIIACLESE